jgi:general secretion pathway protein D
MQLRIAQITLATLLALGTVSSAFAQASNKAGVTLNFVAAEVEAVARTMSTITGKNLVVDPRVKGQITLITEKPVSNAAAYNQFLAALRIVGAVAVEADGLVKIIPEAEAKIQGGPLVIDAAQSPGNKVVTKVINLQHVPASTMVPILRPLINTNNTIAANPSNNALVITDYADNLRRIEQIIAANDIPNADDLEIIPLKHGLASDIATLAQRLIDSTNTSGATPGSEGSYKTAILVDSRTNSILLRSANSARTELLKSLIARLDQPNALGASGNIHVVSLKNADATKLAATLRAAISATATSPAATPAPGSASATANAGAATTGGQIQADTSTNSLIITAPEPLYRQLRAVIDQLDGRRAQVFVESLIVEVSTDKAAEFGLQLQGAFGKAGDALLGTLGSNFGKGGNNIITLAAQGVPAAGSTTATVAPGTGFNLGLYPRINGTNVLSLLARALETTGDGNVLSAPNLLTLDNEEAKIVIGQNVPFVTGQYTNSSSGTTNPFQTIERKDVGLTLKVKPQISENGTVRLQIFQEVSNVQASTQGSANGPTTNKRSIESNVLVEDGAIVVLGGLMQDEYGSSADKVPVMGDLPIVGNLFKSESRNRTKSNLMVFLRPVVVRDATSTQQLSLDRYDLMRGAQQQLQPKVSSVLTVNQAPQLPAETQPGTKAPVKVAP